MMTKQVTITVDKDKEGRWHRTAYEWTYRDIQCEVVWLPSVTGHFNGYIHIPQNMIEDLPRIHDIEHIDLDVHGGLTYGESYGGMDHDEITHCVGFDCAHAEDWTDDIHTYTISGYRSFKDVDFAMKECERLVDQVHEHVESGRRCLS